MEKEEFMDKLLSFMKEEAYKPLTVQELEEMLEITDSDEYKELVKALVTLEEKGLVVRTRSNRYGLPEKMNLIKGKVSAHAKGFAFVLPEDSSLDDVFIPPSELNTAMNGDTVLVRLSTESGGTKKKGPSSASLSAAFRRLSARIQRRKTSASSFPTIKKSRMTSLFRSTPKTAPSRGTKSSSA